MIISYAHSIPKCTPVAVLADTFRHKSADRAVNYTVANQVSLTAINFSSSIRYAFLVYEKKLITNQATCGLDM